MDMRNLVPWNRSRTPANRAEDEGNSFLTLHREINRLFDDMFRGFDLPAAPVGWSAGWPQVDIADGDKAVTLSAELPGLEEKDIELTLADGVLTLRGEKKAEDEGPQYSERWSGRFERAFTLGPDVDPDKVKAAFKNGVLTVTVDKKPAAERSVKRIPIGA